MHSRYSCILKEFYTLETTLAQKIVLTPQNNEFVLKIQYSTPIMQKNSQTFLANFYHKLVIQGGQDYL